MQGRPQAAPSAPRPAAGTLALIALATFAVHVATANRYGYFRDELYYVACGQRLAWGYVDHPPVIAAVAAFCTRALGGSLLALRLPVALSHAALVVVTGLLARRLGGGRTAQGLAALAVAIAPVYLGSASMLTMNPFDQLLWALIVLVLARALAADRPPNGVALGLLAGLGLLNKHSLAFFVATALAALAVTPQRRLLAARGWLVAGALAFACALPNLAWEVAHGWPTLEFLHNAAAHKNLSGNPLEFLGAQALITHPVNLPLVVAGLVWLFRAREAARFRALGWGFVLVFALMFAMKAKHYYLAPAYPPVLAAGAVALVQATSRTRWRWLRPAYAALMLILGLLMLPFTVPVLSPESFVRYSASLGLREPPSERHRPAKLPQTYADMFGWEELAAEVGRVVRALPPDERRRCVVFASNYGEAGALEWWAREYDLPPVVCPHNNYWLWGPPRDTTADVIVTVGEDSSDVAKSCRAVTVASVFRHEWNMPYESDLPICVGRERTLPWSAIWVNSKRFI